MKHHPGDKLLWTPRLMKDALVHAIRTMRALPGGASFSHQGWVEFNDSWGYADDERIKEDRFRPSAKDITRMEIILIGKGGNRALLNGAVLGYREHRTVLIRWALWVAHGCRDPQEPEYVETEADFARRIRRSESEMKRLRDHAADVMADQANTMEIPAWAAEKPVRRRKARGNLHIAGN